MTVTTDKFKLNSGPEKTATWIWLDPEMGGQLKVEYYDYSEPAQSLFGNDIAYLLTVQEIAKLYSLGMQDETSVIEWMAQNFKSYFGIKQWLEESGIGFRKEVDPWA